MKPFALPVPVAYIKSHIYLYFFGRLSLASNGKTSGPSSPLLMTSSAAAPIGFELWQRNSNGICHMDSDDTTADTQSSPSSAEPQVFFQPFKSSFLTLDHPPSSYAFKADHIRHPGLKKEAELHLNNLIRNGVVEK